MTAPEVLPVLFRKMRRKDSEVVALFPTLPADVRGNQLTSYAHIGQHGGASWGWYHGHSHRPATPEEYAPLLRELRGIYEHALSPGDSVYTLQVVRKVTRAHRAAFHAEVLRLNRSSP